MYSLTPFLLFFIIIINSFCLGKIIKRNIYNLSFNISLFIGFFVFCLVFTIPYIPIILVPEISNYYFFYSHIVVQIVLIIVYLFFYKSFNISLIINMKKIIPFFISSLVLIMGYLIFFIHRSQKLDDSINVANSNYFSIINLQLNDFFKTFSSNKYFKNDLDMFINNLYPALLIITTGLFISEFYSIKSYSNIMDFISIIIVSLLFSFFMFNVKNINNSFWSDSFAMLICIKSFIIMLRKNTLQENQNYFITLKISLILLVLLNSSFIIISGCIMTMICLYLFFKKVDFGFDLFIESFIFFIGSFSLFFLSKDFANAPIFTIIFSLLLATTVILLSLFYILKKNYSKSTYWPYVQKTSVVFSKYFRIIYLLGFLVIAGISITSTLSGLNKANDFNIILSRIQFLEFIKNVINYNAINHKELTNSLFIAFYFLTFSFSFIYLIFNFKKLNNYSSNFLFVSSSTFLLFNPLTIFELRYLSSFFVYKYQDNQIYDFTMFFNLLLVINLAFAIDHLQVSKIRLSIKKPKKFLEFFKNNKISLHDKKTNKINQKLQNVKNKFEFKLIFNSMVLKINKILLNRYIYFALSIGISMFFVTFIFVCN